MIEYTSNFYTLREVWQHLASRFKRKPEQQPRQEVLAPQAPQVWMPQTEVERTVYAALILAGEPVNNLKLAALMGVSPGECSRRVAQLEGVIRKARKGREVLISLH
jgi:hypothetical protein